jgi:GntR family transcriptional regulator
VAGELPSSAIDRTSPVPFYFQLRKLLEDEIVSGRWLPGQRLPGESAMCEHFGLSRTTVRQALTELENEGLVRREKGRGTFVAEPRTSAWLLQSAHGFHEEGLKAGHSVTSRVLRKEVGPLPQWAVDALALPQGSDGVTVERLRWVDGRLVMYVVNHLPPELAQTVLPADLENGSLYQVLEERRALTVFGGARVVEAVPAEGDLATLLEVDPGSPILFVESVSWAENQSRFECYRAWHRADRTKIQVQVVHEDVAARAGFDPTTLTIGAR